MRVPDPDHATSMDPWTETFAGQFGKFLVAHGYSSQEALARAASAMRETGERFDLVLTRLGLVSEAHMAALTAQYLGLPRFRSSDVPETALALAGVDADYLRRAACLPVRDNGKALLFAIADPFRSETQAALAFHLGRPIELLVATAAEITQAIDQVYGVPVSVVADTAPGLAKDAQASEDDIRRLTELASEAPVIRLVHDTIVSAVEAEASDIHFEQGEHGLAVRQRIDGLLDTPLQLPPQLAGAVISRIKIMARLNIAERRLPQDGRIRINVRGRDVELRVSTMPTLKGESVVLRILDRGSVALDFAALGFRGAIFENFLKLIDRPNGLILVTGPTGSGKSTTLYAALNRLNQPFRKTFTVEDPVELQLPGVAQVQVQPRIGLTFANALRSILRQDPDIIMVGEIRDLETAQMAMQAALTGHLVLATLHTNSAPATIARLVDMGVEDYLIASTLKGTLAQRLVRRLCRSCSRPTKASVALRACLEVAAAKGAKLQYDGSSLREASGCPDCRNTGFRGRIAICELLMVEETVMEAIVSKGGESLVAEAAARAGMSAMFVDGLEKVLSGETTLDEVLRVTQVPG